MTEDRGPERRALEAAAMEAIESLAFTETLPGTPPEGFLRDHECLAAAIPVDNGGEMAIWMQRDFLRGLSATLFTLPPDTVDDAIMLDALLEFLNIVAGRFMAANGSEERVLTLGLPREKREGPAWTDYPLFCCLREDAGGYFALGLKP